MHLIAPNLIFLPLGPKKHAFSNIKGPTFNALRSIKMKIVQVPHNEKTKHLNFFISKY